MHDGLAGIVPPDIGDFENNLRQLHPPGPQAVTDTADRPLDNVSIHDFGFHEYLLAPEPERPEQNGLLSQQGADYLSTVIGNVPGTFPPDQADALAAFFTNVEIGLRQAITTYWQQTNAQQIAGTSQIVLDKLYGADGTAPGIEALIAYVQPFADFARIFA